MNIILSILMILSNFGSSFDIDKELILNEVNKIRAKGCYCGNEYQEPAGPVKWNDTLYESAMSHAKEMSRYNFFSHFSRAGKDVGQRLSSFGYPWKVVGENIGEGQRHFDQVIEDWLESKTHCKMLMDKRVDEMAVAKYKKYWVQHFGKQFEKKRKRSSK